MASYLFRTPAALATSRAFVSRPFARSLHVSRQLAVGKESALHNENRAAEAEAHKQEQLQQQKQGKGQWKDELASDSESIVKADREELGSSKQTIKDLQEETAKLAEKQKK